MLVPVSVQKAIKKAKKLRETRSEMHKNAERQRHVQHMTRLHVRVFAFLFLISDSEWIGWDYGYSCDVKAVKRASLTRESAINCGVFEGLRLGVVRANNGTRNATRSRVGGPLNEIS